MASKGGGRVLSSPHPSPLLEAKVEGRLLATHPPSSTFNLVKGGGGATTLSPPSTFGCKGGGGVVTFSLPSTFAPAKGGGGVRTALLLFHLSGLMVWIEKTGVSGVLAFCVRPKAARKAKPQDAASPQDGGRQHEYLDCRFRYRGPARPSPGPWPSTRGDSGPAHEETLPWAWARPGRRPFRGLGPWVH